MIVIDGSYGEGGGQVLRTSLSLSALRGEAVRIENIRANRHPPGLKAQHLTGVWAIARICDAELEGDEMGSRVLTFAPRTPPQPGDYTFDVTEALETGSAGSTGLIFQTVLLPLALADGDSTLTIRGGTHVAWSPPFHYLKHVYLPTLARMGVEAEVEIGEWGFFPRGGGEMRATIRGRGDGGRVRVWGGFEIRGNEVLKAGEGGAGKLRGIELVERGALRRVWGISALANLKSHIGQRQANRAENVLREQGLQPKIEVVRAPSPGPGTVIFLVAEFEHVVAGFTAYGRRGKPAERVAEEACDEFLRYYHSGAAVDKHLADQLILPMALTGQPCRFTTSEVTEHLRTVVGVVERFRG